MSGFNASTQTAEQGVARLRAAAEGAGRTLARQIEAAQSLKDDLGFARGAWRGFLADRLDGLVRKARGPTPEPCIPEFESHAAPEQIGGTVAEKRVRSQAERDLLTALRMAR